MRPVLVTPASRREQIRNDLFDELQPVALENCKLERFGESHDGGYLMCGNLFGAVEAGYSYGISGYDGWGCDISRHTSATVHQYDCFDTTAPVCEGGRTRFHGECVAGRRRADAIGRQFDTLVNQVQRNGHAGKRLVVKMDVEGAEWESLLATPDELLGRIDQLAIEMHGSDRVRFVRLIRRLKRHFYVVHLHFNNYSCSDRHRPFPAWAYEVLLVNKSIGIPAAGPPQLPHLLDAPNNPDLADCQVTVTDTTSTR